MCLYTYAQACAFSYSHKVDDVVACASRKAYGVHDLGPQACTCKLNRRVHSSDACRVLFASAIPTSKQGVPRPTSANNATPVRPRLQCNRLRGRCGRHDGGAGSSGWLHKEVLERPHVAYSRVIVEYDTPFLRSRHCRWRRRLNELSCGLRWLDNIECEIGCCCRVAALSASDQRRMLLGRCGHLSQNWPWGRNSRCLRQCTRRHRRTRRPRSSQRCSELLQEGCPSGEPIRTFGGGLRRGPLLSALQHLLCVLHALRHILGLCANAPHTLSQSVCCGRPGQVRNGLPSLCRVHKDLLASRISIFQVRLASCERLRPQCLRLFSQDLCRAAEGCAARRCRGCRLVYEGLGDEVEEGGTSASFLGSLRAAAHHRDHAPVLRLPNATELFELQQGIRQRHCLGDAACRAAVEEVADRQASAHGPVQEVGSAKGLAA
mmetsp:Transcript_33760/g.110400  ORF Transcript_33760/g.110400 Transcript_33760/m.110400 type:complete len:434 (+) Transcript_33760:276-1577(+)